MLSLPAGQVKRLHIDRKAVHEKRPNVIRIRLGKASINVKQAIIKGPSLFIVDMAHPILPEGTYAWIETSAAVDYAP